MFITSIKDLLCTSALSSQLNCEVIDVIELYNNKSHGLWPPGGFSSLFFDQAVPYYPQRHLADWNAIYILHQLDCAMPHVEGSGVSH